MVNLLLAILSSALIAIIMRASSGRVKGDLSMLAVNYAICLALAGIYSGAGIVPEGGSGLAAAAGMGAVNGAFYLASFMMMQTSTRKNGIVLTSLFMKLGLLVPMAVSVVGFGELPTPAQGAGFVIAVGAIVLINFEKGALTAGSKTGLMLLLLLGGGGDAMAKIFETAGPAELDDQFLLFTFAVALLLCAGCVIWKKERPGRRELAYGALIGIPNFFSAKFLLKSLESLEAVIVYPAYSVATILVVTLTGVAVFGERLGKRQWIALAAILAALVLLNI